MANQKALFVALVALIKPLSSSAFIDSRESRSTAPLSSDGRAKTITSELLLQWCGIITEVLLIIITVGSNLPHIAEYVSIGTTKDENILDTCEHNNY